MFPRILSIRRALKWLLPAAAVFIVTTCPVFLNPVFPNPLAAQFMAKQVNLTYLARRADVIVQGTVKEVVHESLPGYKNISTTKVTLNIENTVRGPEGKTYTFREIDLGLQSKSKKSHYAVGQHLLLFLRSPSKYGLSSPIGLEQGRFHIVRNAGGNWMAVNENNNAGLFLNVLQDVREERLRLTANQMRVASSREGPVRLDDFVSLVKKLSSLSRIQ